MDKQQQPKPIHHAYLNEIDPFAVSWLRNLSCADTTIIDNRSIKDVQPKDIIQADRAGVRQIHFFAGIGGWPYALDLAGWPTDLHVWTGSCPCQPFSQAGKQKKYADERHLWPEFFRLIRSLRPPIIFGEQVASKLGREWLTGVRDGLEVLGYAFGASDLCAASVGAPHIRQRLYWGAVRRDVIAGLGNSYRTICKARQSECVRDEERSECLAQPGLPDWLANCDLTRSQGRGLRSHPQPDQIAPWTHGFDLIPCTDGATRRIESGVLPLAHGVSKRVGRIHGYGNAIVPQVGAVFVRSFMEALSGN